MNDLQTRHTHLGDKVFVGQNPTHLFFTTSAKPFDLLTYIINQDLMARLHLIQLIVDMRAGQLFG